MTIRHRAAAFGLVPLVALAGCGNSATAESTPPPQSADPTPTASAPASISTKPSPKPTPTTASASSVSASSSVATPSATPKPSTPSASAPKPTTASSAPRSLPTQPPSTDLAASFLKLQQELSGKVGIAIVPVGGTRQDALTFGTNQSDVAWSTSKVPVAIAALKKSNSSYIRQQAVAAITYSDNDAARNLFRSLGGYATAGKAVDAVLRAGGDANTSFHKQVTTPPVALFGLTEWSLADSATFASSLPCSKDAALVYKLMGQIVDEHRWGLGTLPGARLKGGWGDRPNGYVDRQLGVVTMPDGSQLGVAIMVTSNGGPDAADADLTRIAKWLKANYPNLEGGRCG